MKHRVLAGYVTVVQEQRFRLLTDNGRACLFTLGRKSSLQPAALRRIQKSRSRIWIDYSGEPNTASAVVHEIRSAGK